MNSFNCDDKCEDKSIFIVPAGRRWRLPVARGLVLALSIGAALPAGVLIPAAPAQAGSGWCELTVEDRQERAHFILGLMLSWVNASDSQRNEIKAIVDGLFDDVDIQSLAAQHCDRRQAFIDAFINIEADTGTGAGANRLEALRAEAMESTREPSIKFVKAVADIGRVLNSDQRAELVDTLQNLRALFGRFRGFNRLQ